MHAKMLDGREIDLSSEQLDRLRTQLQGHVLLPGESGYEASRSLWNAMIDRKPAVIVCCLGTTDVMAGIRFAREHNLLLCIKGGGHNIAGMAVADGALMLDMSPMRGVWVDRERRIAHAQAGCILADVDRETQLHGLATVLGFVSTTGIAGLTLGGGFGYLTRRWGWTTDNVIGMDVVTADAELVHASQDENPDLFWALRGGGGNFGVVTGFDYCLYPVGPEVVGGIVAWPASEAKEVLELYRSLAEKAPPELTLVAFLRPAPPAPWLPPERHGTPIVAILACYSGDPNEGEEIVAPIKTFGNPIGDVLVRRPYSQVQTLLDATQPKGRRYYWKSEYLAHVDSRMCETMIEHAQRIRSPHSAVVLFQLGDALSQHDDEHSPVGNRSARYVFNVTGAWEEAAEDRMHIEWVREAWRELQPFSTGGTYINFLTEDEGPERLEAALGTSALRHLAQVKAHWDPENRLQINRNIVPR
ncbi:FAD-binding oxidoreductase [Aidingimonas lacisalsi]|uniref:FAD-binding oxidoreductase n=1 Tax=Aidingimonas lacisalsi TaxID=2604086 RepID=UPI0011D1B084|nr:FAD-binding oxidoreductase [Aidingimonas lacisalsi]